MRLSDEDGGEGREGVVGGGGGPGRIRSWMRRGMGDEGEEWDELGVVELGSRTAADDGGGRSEEGWCSYSGSTTSYAATVFAATKEAEG